MPYFVAWRLAPAALKDASWPVVDEVSATDFALSVNGHDLSFLALPAWP